MIILLCRKLSRLLALIVLLIFVLPLLIFYLSFAANPTSVRYQNPAWEIVEVAAAGGKSTKMMPKLTRFRFFLHDFYQNGL